MTNKTYSGLPKPMGGSGHFYESRRHSLQARGIKTGNLAQHGKVALIVSGIPALPGSTKQGYLTRYYDKEHRLIKEEKEKKMPNYNELPKNDPLFTAINIASQSQGTETFWIGKLRFSLDKVKKDAEEYNKILEGTGATAQWELARNYNMRGIPYGVAVTGFTPEAEKKLMKKFGFGEDDLWLPED